MSDSARCRRQFRHSPRPTRDVDPHCSHPLLSAWTRTDSKMPSELMSISCSRQHHAQRAQFFIHKPCSLHRLRDYCPQHITSTDSQFVYHTSHVRVGNAKRLRKLLVPNIQTLPSEINA